MKGVHRNPNRQKSASGVLLIHERKWLDEIEDCYQ